jgi:hypothetical protein
MIRQAEGTTTIEQIVAEVTEGIIPKGKKPIYQMSFQVDARDNGSAHLFVWREAEDTTKTLETYSTGDSQDMHILHGIEHDWTNKILGQRSHYKFLVDFQDVKPKEAENLLFMFQQFVSMYGGEITRTYKDGELVE